MSKNLNHDVSDEMLMAHADGELNDQDAKALDARIAQDPALQARHAIFTGTAAALQAAMTPGPVPDCLVQAVQTGYVANSRAQTAPVKAQRGPMAQLWPMAQFWPMALAATLLMGVGLGWWVNNTGLDAAQTELADAAQTSAMVQTGQSTDLPQGSRLRVLGTFETTRGICRLLLLASNDETKTRFVACKTDMEWQIAMSVLEGSNDVFAPASSDASELIDGFLDLINAGPALSSEEESELLFNAQSN